MEEIARLRRCYLQHRLGFDDWQSCVDWAIERLQRDDEGDDLDIVMLAAATNVEEVWPLVSAIVSRYLDGAQISDDVAAGKYIVELHTAYLSKSESIETLEQKFWKIFNRLNQPSWLAMLARNCEYATDMDFYEKPFEDEFSYISGLWSRASTLNEFLVSYDRNISNSHEADWQPVKNS